LSASRFGEVPSRCWQNVGLSLVFVYSEYERTEGSGRMGLKG